MKILPLETVPITAWAEQNFLFALRMKMVMILIKGFCDWGK